MNLWQFHRMIAEVTAEWCISLSFTNKARHVSQTQFDSHASYHVQLENRIPLCNEDIKPDVPVFWQSPTLHFSINVVFPIPEYCSTSESDTGRPPSPRSAPPRSALVLPILAKRQELPSCALLVVLRKISPPAVRRTIGLLVYQ